MKHLDLSIRTTQVEIKVVKVGGSKMTLSVFNQIQEEPIFDKELNLKGEILGYIVKKNENYCLYVKDSELRKVKLIEPIKGIEGTSDWEAENEFIYSLRAKKWLNQILTICDDSEKFRFIKDSREEMNSDDIQTMYNLEIIDKYNGFRKKLLENNNQLYIAV